MCVLCSVTRFDKISPNFKSLWPNFEGLLDICRNFEPTLAYFVYFWTQILIECVCLCVWIIVMKSDFVPNEGMVSVFEGSGSGWRKNKQNFSAKTPEFNYPARAHYALFSIISA